MDLIKYEDALNEVKQLAEVLDKNVNSMSFSCNKIAPWKDEVTKKEEPFNKTFRKEVPGMGASSKSGVYFICDLDENILYLGKATSNNLGAEIYGKFSKASEVDENDIARFETSSLAKYAPHEWKETIRSGKILIRAITIEPKESSALVEVYLQTWCHRKGKWPPLNKRIG